MLLSFIYGGFYPPQITAQTLHTFSAYCRWPPVKIDPLTLIVWMLWCAHWAIQAQEKLRAGCTGSPLQTVQRFHSIDLLVPGVVLWCRHLSGLTQAPFQFYRGHHMHHCLAMKVLALDNMFHGRSLDLKKQLLVIVIRNDVQGAKSRSLSLLSGVC